MELLQTLHFHLLNKDRILLLSSVGERLEPEIGSHCNTRVREEILHLRMKVHLRVWSVWRDLISASEVVLRDSQWSMKVE